MTPVLCVVLELKPQPTQLSPQITMNQLCDAARSAANGRKRTGSPTIITQTPSSSITTLQGVILATPQRKFDGHSLPPAVSLPPIVQNRGPIVKPHVSGIRQHIQQEPGFGFMYDNPSYSDKILVFKAKDRPAQSTKNNSNDGIQSDPTIYVSSFFLSGRSVYFKNLFTSHNVSTPQSQPNTHQKITLELELLDIPPSMDLIRCIYTENLIARTCSQLLRTLELADKFEIPSLLPIIASKIEITAKTLQHHLSILGLPDRLSSLDSMGSVVEAAKNFVRSRCSSFEEYYVKEEKEYRSLPLQCLKTLIRSDLIKVDSENTLWRATCSWMSGRPFNVIDEIIPCIRFPLMDVHYLRDVVKNSVVFKLSTHLQDRYTKAMEFHSYVRTSKRRKTERDTEGECFTPRGLGVEGQRQMVFVFERKKIKALPPNLNAAYCSPCHIISAYVMRLVICRSGPLLGIGLEIMKKASMLEVNTFQVDVQFELTVNGQKGNNISKTLEQSITPIGFLRSDEFDQMGEDLEVDVRLVVNPQK